MEAISYRPAIYARFSSARQDERSIDDQIRRCRDHLGPAAEHVEVFADYAVSGASLHRRGFESLMAAVEAGTITAVVTEDISRISRDFADAAQIFKRLQYARVPLIGVADGIDTSAKHAKLTYTLKSLVADLYLDDLRDKTLRGMEGRALAGYATGQVPYGYKTASDTDKRGRELGRRIEIVKVAAGIIVRIFSEWAEGKSMSTIARQLNRDGIDSPRIGTRHQFAGWSVGTVRAMLRNERYIGVWRFKRMQWIKVPATGRRLPRQRAASEVITFERPELRIVGLPLWEAAHARIAKGHPLRGCTRARSRYLLSGLLRCAECNASMTIVGGANLPNTFYRCTTNRTKGICSNAMGVRAVALLSELFDALRRQVTVDPCVLAAIAAHNGNGSAELNDKVRAGEATLAETECQIERLVEFVTAGGRRFDYVAEKLKRLEVVARTQKAELEVLRSTVERPMRKVSAKEIAATITRLSMVGQEDVETARTRIARWLGAGSMRFDGRRVTVEFVPPALVQDIARNGTPAPSGVRGKSITIEIQVEHLVPRAQTLADARPATG